MIEPTDSKPLTPLQMPTIQPTLPGVRLSNSGQILNKESRIAKLIWAPGGYGKTHLAGSLDALTQKYHGKRTLYIACEAGEGGGAATLHNLSIPLFTPKDHSDMYKTLGYLRNDKTIGGVVFDSATFYTQHYVKKAALVYPAKENSATRSAGIPTRSDYQVMGELMSQILNALLQMTTSEDPAYRKHIVVTAADMTREVDEKVTFIGPALPGRMASEAVQLFQQVGTISIKPQLVDGKRQLLRFLTFQGDGVKALKDRWQMYPQEIQLRTSPTAPGDDLLSMYEKWWLPAVAEAQKGQLVIS